MNIVHGIALVAAACMSVFHLILSVVMFQELNSRVMWYLGVDVGTAATLSFNFVVTRMPHADRLPWRLLHGVNGLGVVYTLFNYYAMIDWGNAFAIVVYTAIFIGGLLSDRQKARNA